MDETQAILRSLDIDPVNGVITWRHPSKYHRRLAGAIAGTPQASRNGKIYWVVKINRKKFKRGRIVYLYTHGKWPSPCVDHIDGNSLNDKALNLREATTTENAWNHKGRKKRSDLPMGVRKTASGKFQARIAHHKKVTTIGVFATAELAEIAYREKRAELYGAFSGY